MRFGKKRFQLPPIANRENVTCNQPTEKSKLTLAQNFI
jgi:hypothetical protein